MRGFFKLLFWMNLWAVTYIVTYPFKPSKHGDNCLTYALRRWAKDDGYLVIRWCRSNMISWVKWPHFLWLDSTNHQNLHHLIPDDDSSSRKHLIPDLWFKGHTKNGDDEDNEN